MRVTWARTWSGDPFTKTSVSVTTLIILRSESNGKILMRFFSFSRIFSSDLAASTRRAHSVGSPRILYVPSSSVSSDSLHFHAVSMTFAKRIFPSFTSLMLPIRGLYPAHSMVIFSPLARRISRTVIWFFVSVPVLSEQIVVTAPSVSTAPSFFTMTDLPARTEAPSASAIVIVVGSPSGTAAIAIETA